MQLENIQGENHGAFEVSAQHLALQPKGWEGGLSLSEATPCVSSKQPQKVSGLKPDISLSSSLWAAFIAGTQPPNLSDRPCQLFPQCL